MKFALVNGERREAQPGLSGECPGCGSAMIARCGEINVWHWAHRAAPMCDHWWEPETEWHRDWKGQFPLDWQEVIHRADDSERHIADVKTLDGWAIEFQHSYIKPEERRSREAFYEKLVWVVDGLRRKTDWARFQKAWEGGRPVGVPTLRSALSNECRLLREWAGSPGPVFLDFGGPYLVWILGGRSGGSAYFFLLPRAEFVGIHRGTGTQDFDSFAKEVLELIAELASSRRDRRSFPDPLQVRGGRRRRPL